MQSFAQGIERCIAQGAEKRIQLAGKNARYYHFSDPTLSPPNETKQPIAHFYGGNGFPVGVYQPLIAQLSQYFNMVSLAMQGYWYDLPTDKVLTREQDADFLIEFLDKTQDKPIIAIGHSQGATATAIAAARRPDLFSALYFIDPVTFTKTQKILYGLIPHFILMTQEPFKSTHLKKENWVTTEEYYQYLRQHRAFKRISDEHLHIFAKNSLVKKGNDSDKIHTSTPEHDFNINTDDYELLFSPKQELASYFDTPYIDAALKSLNKTATPYCILLGKPSVFNSQKVRQGWHKFVPKQNIHVFPDYGHLLPMEAPTECAKVIIKLEQERLKRSL